MKRNDDRLPVGVGLMLAGAVSAAMWATGWWAVAAVLAWKAASPR